MDNSELIGVFEPKCKIRFLSDPHPQEDYIAISAKEYQELLASSMRGRALEYGVGQNKLGKLLMKVRSEIKKERGLA